MFLRPADGLLQPVLPEVLRLTRLMSHRLRRLLQFQQAVTLRPTLTLQTFCSPRGLQSSKSTHEQALDWENTSRTQFLRGTHSGGILAWSQAYGLITTQPQEQLPLPT